MACTFLSGNKRFAVVKEETTPGTPEWDLSATFPADSDYDCRITGIEVTPDIGFDDEAGDVRMGTHGELESIAGAQAAEIKLSFPMPWGGAVGTPFKYSKILQGCGLAETAYGATGIGWQPLSSMDCNSLTIVIFEPQIGDTPAAVGYLFAGCVGNIVISVGGIGQPYMAECTFKGILVDIVDVANGNIPEITGAGTEVAERLLDNTFTVGGTALKISNFSLDAGNDVQPVIDQDDSTGYKHFYVANRKPRFSCNPLGILVASDDVLARVNGMDNDAISLATPSAHFTIDIPRAQALNPTKADREGLSAWEQNYKCLRNHNGSAAANGSIPNECTWELLQGARA